MRSTRSERKRQEHVFFFLEIFVYVTKRHQQPTKLSIISVLIQAWQMCLLVIVFREFFYTYGVIIWDIFKLFNCIYTRIIISLNILGEII